MFDIILVILSLLALIGLGDLIVRRKPPPQPWAAIFVVIWISQLLMFGIRLWTNL